MSPIFIIMLVGLIAVFVSHAVERRYPSAEAANGVAPGASIAAGGMKRSLRGFSTRGVMTIIISFLVLAAALYVILSRQYPDAEQKWAFGVVGTLLGYWLKT